MGVRDTLSTGQWSSLQALFDSALELDAGQRDRLVDATNVADPVLGRSLAAMLAAHAQWESKTEQAQDDLQRQTHASNLLANGATIGPYRVLGVLGEGGMGVVYRAERADGEVALTAAIKVLRPRALDADAHERFRRERDLLAGLSHPHIARVFDAGVAANGQPYFVMEYVRGENIARWCDERRLDIRARLRLFLDVCDAVRHAHNQLVLHRDIKPSNVLVDASGVAKLIDFGIAKPIALDGAGVAETATAQRFFSPMNVAPEQLRGGVMGVACDVYQLGTLLYELLCGRPIFELAGLTPKAIEDAILRRMPVAPGLRARSSDADVASARGCADGQVLAKQLAGDLDEIVLTALRKEPGLRYPSVEQLMDDIGRHLDVLPVRARGSHRSYRARLFVKRHWRSLAVAGTATIAAVTFVTAIAVQSRQLQRERDHAVAEQHRAEEATKFLVDVFKAADPTVSLSRDTPIGDVLANGRRELDTELAGQPRLVGDLSFALAGIYLDLDELADAGTYANRALRLRAALDPGSMAEADSRAQLTVIEGRAGDCKGAISEGALAVDLFRRLGAGVSRSIDAQAQLIGCEAQDQGKAHAIARTKSLLDALIRDPESNARQIASLELSLAAYDEEIGDAKSAGRLRQSAADRLQRSPWKDSTVALNAQAALAATLSQNGQFDQARALFDRLVPQYERIYGSNSLNRAELLLDRGNNFARSGRSGEAEADLHDAGKAFREQEILATSLSMDRKSDHAGAIFDRLARDYERLYGRNSLDYADLLSERGKCFFDRRRFREAEADMLEARRIRGSLEQGPRIDQARAAQDLADLYQVGFGDATRAGAFHDEAVRIATATLGADDLDTVRLKTERAVWLERVGRSQEAGDELRILQEQLARRDRVGIDVRLAFAAAEALSSGKRPDAAARLAEVGAAVSAHPAFVDYTRSYSYAVHAAMPMSYTNDVYNLPTTPYLQEQVEQVWKAIQDEWHVQSCHYDLSFTREDSKVAKMTIGPAPKCRGLVDFYLVGVPPGYYLGPERGPMRQKVMFMLPQDDPAKAAPSK